MIIDIKFIEDRKEYESKGHRIPVVEISNDFVCTWLSVEDLSMSSLKREVEHIKKQTEYHLSKRVD